jgi:hypothetical protein
MDTMQPEKLAPLNPKELQLIMMIREIKEGELVIYVANCKPVKVEEIQKDVEL